MVNAVEGSALRRWIDNTNDVVVLAGSAVSAMQPSGVPGVYAFKKAVVAALMCRAGCGHLQGLAETVASSPAVKLEATLQALDDATDQVWADRVAASTLKVTRANDLHRWIAACVADGSFAGIVTTNWDLLLEQAYRDATGASVERWCASEPDNPSARLLKVHGSADLPRTLRHTFERINLGLPTTEGRLPGILAAPLLVVGYSGSDYDVMRCIPPVGGPIYWVAVDANQPPPGVRELAARADLDREVYVVDGGFVSLPVPAPAPGTDPAVLAEVTQILATYPDVAAADALDALLFNGRVAADGVDEDWAADRDRQRLALTAADNEFLDWLGAVVPEERRLAARAAREQDHGSPVLAARMFWRAGRQNPAQRARRRSDAADCAQRGRWRQLVVRPLVYPIHVAAHRAAIRDREHPREVARMALRMAISLAAMGRHRRVINLINATIGGYHEQMGTYMEAQLLRRRALARAAMGDSGWDDDLREALDRFSFEKRTAEVASVLRTRAGCLFITGAERGLVDSAIDASIAAHPADVHVARSEQLRQLCRHRFLGRLLVRFLA